MHIFPTVTTVFQIIHNCVAIHKVTLISFHLTVLKIYKVILLNGQHFALEPSHWSGSDIFSRALSHKPNNIDIFANAWAPTKAFDTLDQATREAIKNGAKNVSKSLKRMTLICQITIVLKNIECKLM